MSSAVDTDAGGVPSVGADGVGPSLRRLRESQGWSISDVSARVKFSARQIDALENERWDDLPKGLSLRGLVRNYARMLDADPEALILALESHIGTAQVVRESSISETPSHIPLYQEPESRGSLIWLIVILAVLVAAVVYALGQGWLPQEWLPGGWFSGSAS